MFHREREWNSVEPMPSEKPKSIVEPAFGSRAQAVGFLLVVVGALLLPIVIDNSGMVTRRSSYELMSSTHGAYSYIEKEIFEKDGDIDILFIGSSVLWRGIDTRQVQRALSEQLGREATVMTFGYDFNGIDTAYMILRDLTQRRRVHLVVFTIPRGGIGFREGPSTVAYKFLSYTDHPEVVADMPWDSKVAIYAGNVLRSPRDLLLMLRPGQWRPSNVAADLGSKQVELGFDATSGSYVPIDLPPIDPSDAIPPAASDDKVTFTGNLPSHHQRIYLDHLLRLLDRTHTPLAIMNIPEYTERSSDKLVERFDWSARLGREIPLFGVRPKAFFAGLDDEQSKLLCSDDSHLNKNGSQRFTRGVIPALLMTYKDYASKDF